MPLTGVPTKPGHGVPAIWLGRDSQWRDRYNRRHVLLVLGSQLPLHFPHQNRLETIFESRLPSFAQPRKCFNLKNCKTLRFIPCSLRLGEALSMYRVIVRRLGDKQYVAKGRMLVEDLYGPTWHRPTRAQCCHPPPLNYYFFYSQC